MHRAFETILTILTQPISTWDRRYRRAFIATLPLSGPLLLALRTIMAFVVVAVVMPICLVGLFGEWCRDTWRAS